MTTGNGRLLSESLDRFGGLDVCVISDAVDALGLRAESVAATIPALAAAWEGARALGWAVPMQLADGPAPAESVHLGSKAISLAQPGNVIVVDNGGRPDAGSWGGLLSTAASKRGVGGVVAHGAVRDVDEARNLGFALFSTGSTPQTARGRCHEVSCGEPIRIGQVSITLGDLVAADGTGVVVVARKRALDVLEKALDLSRRESSMRDALLRGIDVMSVLSGAYEDMLNSANDGAEVSK